MKDPPFPDVSGATLRARVPEIIIIWKMKTTAHQQKINK